MNRPAFQTLGISYSSEKFFILFLILGSLFIRLINLDSPLLTGNSFRQTMTAITVWTFIQEGISVFEYQTPVFGPPWTIPMEFPIYQLTVALIVKSGIGNIDLAGRITTILYFYFSSYFLFLICKHYINKTAATCILLAYIWSPFTILWSRNVLIDYSSVAFCLAYFYFFTRWMYDAPRTTFFLLTIGFGILGYLTKVTTLPVVLVPMAYLLLIRLWELLKKDNFNVHHFTKSHIRFLMFQAGIFLIPIFPFYCWLLYADTVKAASEFTAFLTSAGLSEWNFGTWLQKTTMANWTPIIKRIISHIVTYPGLVFLILGPPLYLKSSKKCGDFIVIFMIGAFLTIFTFFNLYSEHDYYLIAVSPSMSILTGYCCYLLLSKVLDDDFNLKKWSYVSILIISISIFSSGDFLKWMLEVRYDDSYPSLGLAKAIRENTTENDYVIIADVFNWDPQYLYYAKRKGFMLWNFEGEKSNRFFKKHNFTTIVHVNPHKKLFSNWKYSKVLTIYDKFKVVRVSDHPIISAGS